MRARTDKLTDVESADLVSRLAEFEGEGAKPITVERQPDGRWTVIAIVPVADKAAP